MKQLLIFVMIFGLLVLPAAAVPYTETELEEYMQAIYCEPVWVAEYPQYQLQFMDVDFDGRKELLTMETGEEYAPKNAHVLAFMDAELSHRGFLTIGKVDVCRDPVTNESFVVNYVDCDGVRVAERLAYDSEAMLISAHELPGTVADRLESYGYSPIVITNTEWNTVKVYEDCRAMMLPVYQHDDCAIGEPPLVETPDEGETHTFPTVTIVGIVVVMAVASVLATIALRKHRKTA